MISGNIETSRFLIPYRVIGDSGEPVICVNGAQQCIASNRGMARRLSSAFRVVLFDGPGQGRARVLSGPFKITLEEQRNVIEALVQHLGLDRVHMIAMSWGSIVGVSYAATFPHRIKRLVLGSMACTPRGRLLKMVKNGLSLADSTTLDDVQMKQQVGQMMVEGFGEQLSEGMKMKIVKQFHGLDKELARCFHEHCRFVGSIGHISELVDLARIEAETLLVAGEKDTIVGEHDLAYVSRVVPNVQRVMVKDVGHFLHLEPGREDVSEIYLDFFRSGHVNAARAEVRMPAGEEAHSVEALGLA